jgi:hypothetical protein
MKKSLIIVIAILFNNCMIGEALFKSSVSVVYLAGGAVLLSSASVSASIDSVSRSFIQSSRSSIPAKEKGSQEYGIEPQDSKSNQPKPKEKWSDLDTRYVQDVQDTTVLHFKSDGKDEELEKDIQFLGSRTGHLSSDRMGLSLVGIGLALFEVGMTEQQFNETVSYLKITNLYGKNCLIYGYRLKNG